MDTNRLRHLTVVPFLLALLVVLGACSGGDADQGADPMSAGGGSADVESAGLSVITPHVDELAKGGGYIRCTSLWI